MKKSVHIVTPGEERRIARLLNGKLEGAAASGVNSKEGDKRKGDNDDIYPDDDDQLVEFQEKQRRRSSVGSGRMQRRRSSVVSSDGSYTDGKTGLMLNVFIVRYCEYSKCI